MRTCIFCNQQAATLEHAWSDWIIQLLGTAFTVEAWLGPNAARKQWRDAPTRVRYLCRGCNNGWMCDLEGKVRPWVGALMNDLALRLDRTQQGLLAAWGVKTAMVFECTDPTGAWFYTKAERVHLRTSLSPPLGTLIWLGRHERSNLTFCEARKLFGPRPENDPVLSEGYVITVAVARLVMQILTIRRHAEHEGRFAWVRAKPGPWSQSLVQIWPSQPSIHWPPASSFSEPALDELSQRFTNPP